MVLDIIAILVVFYRDKQLKYMILDIIAILGFYRDRKLKQMILDIIAILYNYSAGTVPGYQACTVDIILNVTAQ